MSGYLVLKPKIGSEIYIIPKGSEKREDIIALKLDTSKDNHLRLCINAPQSYRVYREEIAKKEGGLDKLIRKSGSVSGEK